MRISKIDKYSIANGDGVRVAVFVSGCNNHCKGCFNPETWDFDYGDIMTEKVLSEIVQAVSNEYCSGLTVLGGEPMDIRNQPGVATLLARVHSARPEKTIWLYTGYEYEDLIGSSPVNLGFYTKLIDTTVDVMVDGRFIEEQKVLGEFRGSANQRFLSQDDRKQIRINRRLLKHSQVR